MSYNLSKVRVKNCTLEIPRGVIIAAENKLPEINPFDDLDLRRDTSEWIKIKDFCWSGEGSGYTFDYLLECILPKSRGELNAVLIWEGGDSMERLVVKNGKVSREDVDL